MEQSSIQQYPASEEPSLHRHQMLILGDFYQKYAQEVCRYVCAYTHNKMAAEDMTHDLFLKLASLDVINGQTAKALLFTTASRMIVDDVRHKTYVRRYERYAMEQMDSIDTYSVEQKIDNDQMAQVISLQLEEMTPRRADVYTLYFREGLHAKEIAQKLDLSVRTVESHIYQSRKQVTGGLKQAFDM